MESKVLVGWCTLTSSRGVCGRMQCVDVKSEKSSRCRIRLFNVRLISTHRLFIHDIHVSMTLFSFFSFRPGDLLLSPLQQAVEVPSPTRGAMGSAESLSSSLPGLGENMYNLRIFIKRTVHSLSVTVPCQSWGFHRCFCFNYLGDRENEGVSSNAVANEVRQGFVHVHCRWKLW